MPKRKPDTTVAEPSRKSTRIANRVQQKHKQESSDTKVNHDGDAQNLTRRSGSENEDSPLFEPYNFQPSIPAICAPTKPTIITIHHNQESYPAILPNQTLFSTLLHTTKSTRKYHYEDLRATHQLAKIDEYDTWCCTQLRASMNECLRDKIGDRRLEILDLSNDIRGRTAEAKKDALEQLWDAAFALEEMFVDCKLLEPAPWTFKAIEKEDIELEAEFKIPEIEDGEEQGLLRVFGIEAETDDTPAPKPQLEGGPVRAKEELKAAREHLDKVRERVEEESLSFWCDMEGYDEENLTNSDMDLILLDRARKSAGDLIQAEKKVKLAEQIARQAGLKTESILEIPDDASLSEVSWSPHLHKDDRALKSVIEGISKEIENWLDGIHGDEAILEEPADLELEVEEVEPWDSASSAAQPGTRHLELIKS